MAMDFLRLLPIGDASSSSAQAGSRDMALASGSSALQDEDSTIDDLMRLIEDGPGVDSCRDQDVDELLKSLQPKEGWKNCRAHACKKSMSMSHMVSETYHCKQLHALNQSLEMENASMRLKLSDVEQTLLPPRRDFEVFTCAVSTPEVAEVVQPKAPKDVFLRPESDDEVQLPAPKRTKQANSSELWMETGGPWDAVAMSDVAKPTDLVGSVQQWKQVLEDRSGSVTALRHALDELRKLGALPTKILQETKVGVVVNQLGKDAGTHEEVRNAARALLADWKEMHRKRTREPQEPVSAAAKKPKQATEGAEAVHVDSSAAVGAAGVVGKLGQQRQKVLQMLEVALTLGNAPKDAPRDAPKDAAHALAEAVEEALHAQLGSDKAYINQSRAILFNLKDASNGSFRQKLLDGSLEPHRLPRMSSEEMASDLRVASRAELRQQALQESAVKAPAERVTDAYTCERCKGKQCTYVIVTPTSCVNGEHSWTSISSGKKRAGPSVDRKTSQLFCEFKARSVKPADPNHHLTSAKTEKGLACFPHQCHPWSRRLRIRGSPGGDSLRAIGVAPSRMTSFQTFRDIDDDDPEHSMDPEYVDAKSMRFDTLVSHRLQLITDTRLADDNFFHKGEWYQTLSLCGSLEENAAERLSEVIVNSVIFKTVSTLAIAANALYIGIRTDQQLKDSYLRINGGQTTPISNAFEYAFFVWFSGELLLYLVAYRTSFFIGRNWHWNLFDLFLIANAALELLIPDLFANMSFLRICRVFRLVRVVRLVRTVKWLRSLRTMLFAMISSLGSLIWAFVMICFIMFVFSIIFGNAAVAYFENVSSTDQTDLDNAEAVYDTFGSIYESFVTLFGAIFGGTDWMMFQPILRLLGSDGYGELYFCMFLFYIGFCLVGLLNVVTGIFVDSAVTTRTEDEVVDSYREDLQRTSDEVKRIFHSADIGDSGRLTLEAFSQCLKQNAWVAAYFAGLDIGADDAGTIFTLMDTNNSGDITVEEFVQGTMKLKGHAKSIDIFAIMFDMTRLGLQVQKLCSLVEDQFRDVKRHLPDKDWGPPGLAKWGLH
ncbi:TCEA1 [Symbiodinium natans]|uniref:TCEA1 protein n=1 Tax=Symbiodinium natans TaxID=878477 RepID=A0A812RJY6_9DINO|nr:TCEA1 [Symbiodinium natans]